MSFTEILIFLLLCSAFFSLSLWIVYIRDRAPAESEHLYSFRQPQKYLYFPWGKIWFYDSDPEGKRAGLPIVFIHSIGSSMYSWRHQIDVIQQKRRVIAFDLLGFGKSDKPLDQDFGLDGQDARLIALLNKLEIKKCDLVGCSLGGALSLWLAAHYPDRIHKIITMAPAATPSVVPFLSLQHHLLSPVASRMISRSIIHIALRGSYSRRQNITPDVIENYFAPFADKNATACFLKTIDAIKDSRIFDALKTITCPVLLLWGENDRVVTRTAIKKIFHEIPCCQEASHPTGGHHLMEDEPQWTNEKILNFLDEGQIRT